jgi:AbrB family looped-hinge helix DNA binding protein
MLMTRVTGKLQITLPKRLAETYGIRVGDEVELVAAGERISILPPNARRRLLPLEERLRQFDQATRRQQERNALHTPAPSADRGWRRDELYERGRSR